MSDTKVSQPDQDVARRALDVHVRATDLLLALRTSHEYASSFEVALIEIVADLSLVTKMLAGDVAP